MTAISATFSPKPMLTDNATNRATPSPEPGPSPSGRMPPAGGIGKAVHASLPLSAHFAARPSTAGQASKATPTHVHASDVPHGRDPNPASTKHSPSHSYWHGVLKQFKNMGLDLLGPLKDASKFATKHWRAALSGALSGAFPLAPVAAMLGAGIALIKAANKN